MARKTKAKFDPNVFLATLDGGRSISSFKTDGVVFEQGTPANAVLYIQKGKIKIVVTSEQGKEAVVAILGAGRLLRRGMPDRPAAAPGDRQAMTDCKIMRIEKSADGPRPAAGAASSPNCSCFTCCAQQPGRGGPGRSAVQLQRKAAGPDAPFAGEFRQGRRPQPITTKISQETLAEIIGTTRSRVSHFMNKFRKLGFIEYNGQLQVHSALLGVLLHD